MIDRLDDWLTGALSPKEEATLEDELFSAAARGALPKDVAALDRMLAAGRLLLVGGTIEPGLVRADIARLAATGRKLEIVDVVSDLVTPADADIVVLRVGLPDVDVASVDLVTMYEGVEVQVLRDLPVAPGAREVLCCCEGERVRAGAGASVHLRVVARDGANARVLRELTVTPR